MKEQILSKIRDLKLQEKAKELQSRLQKKVKESLPSFKTKDSAQ